MCILYIVFSVYIYIYSILYIYIYSILYIVFSVYVYSLCTLREFPLDRNLPDIVVNGIHGSSVCQHCYVNI